LRFGTNERTGNEASQASNKLPFNDPHDSWKLFKGFVQYCKEFSEDNLKDTQFLQPYDTSVIFGLIGQKYNPSIINKNI